MCDKYGLPETGGVFDQSVLLMNNMRTAKNVFDAFNSMINHNGDQKQWTEQYPHYWKIVASVKRLEVEQNANRS